MGQKYHPARLFLARCVYWSIWGPAVAVAIPFQLVSVGADFLADRLFPRIGDFIQPAWGAAHSVALACGNAVLGFKPDENRP